MLAILWRVVALKADLPDDKEWKRISLKKQDEQDEQDEHAQYFSIVKTARNNKERIVTKQFEYRVCAMQNGRITFVNGQWQGTIGPGTEDPNQALETCPVVWSYLQGAGQDGWELAGAMNQPLQDVHLQTLFLKREISAPEDSESAQQGA